MLVGTTGAGAATYKPNTRGDHNPNRCTPRDCTLREAVIKANAHAGRDKIVLEGGRPAYQLRRAGRSEDAAATGDLDLNDDLVLKSAGRKRATIDGNGIDRVIDAIREEEATITLSRLRIRGGRTEGLEGGGGVRVGQGGAVRIRRSDVRGNRSFRGGGITSLGFGTLIRISKSTISRNRAPTEAVFEGKGGGLYIDDDTLLVTGSTIFENGATGDGGGLHIFGDGSLTNTTIANNSADGHGGGVWSQAALTLNSATVARNLANADGAGGHGGGGLFNSGNPFTVRNSIVANNSVGAGGSGPDCYQGGDFTQAGVNLVSNPGLACDELDEPPTIVANPRLGDFGMNGGPTPTIALRSGSPAINAAGAGSPPRDQRGVRRRNPDIGAYERR
jgi:hypothetical protein